MDDSHYKPTTHHSPTPVSWVSETRCHYTSPWQDVRQGDQGREGETDVCERVDGSPSPGSGMHATACFRGNKDERNVLTDMLVSICGVAVDIRISICETDTSFIGYRLTSLAITYTAFSLTESVISQLLNLTVPISHRCTGTYQNLLHKSFTV